MVKISAVIISFNEEEHIGICLESLKGVADEIVVVDSYSTDSTEEICRRYGVKFFRHHFEGYSEQKNYATSLATSDHVLSLDADEALSDELKASILKVKENFPADGYYFNRRNQYCGRWMKHSRLYPDRHLRLFNRKKGKWVGPNPHDSFRLENGSKQVWLRGDLLHLFHKSIEEHIDKINRFSTIAAREYYRSGRKGGIITGLFHMWWSFFRGYFLSLGFLDGFHGYMYCSINAWGSFLKYAKLKKLSVQAKNKDK